MLRTPQVSDYAFLSDCHSSALVSCDGSIDWCCMPRIDSRSCFGRLLDWERGGFCRVAPETDYRMERRYRADSLVLETLSRTQQGAVRVVDCLLMREGGRHDPYRQIVRLIEGLEGDVPIRIDVVPRFDYGAIEPWVREAVGGGFQVVGGADGLLVSSDLPLAVEGRHRRACRTTIAAGARRHLSMIYADPESLESGLLDAPSAKEVASRVEATEAWWRRWARQGRACGFDAAQSRRSAVVLKGLIHAPTGAVAAAATSSLPEAPGGSRNWDYRFSWVRDSVFAVHSLFRLGFVKEADGFRRFVERSTAGNADEIQVLYGVDGRRRLDEQIIRELSGFGGAAPVRAGNAATAQLQLDVFGELLDLAYIWHREGNPPDPDYWEFIVRLVERTIAVWRRPDQGLWEMRGPARHFVHSKAMCWAALDDGLRLCEELDLTPKDLERWRSERGAVREAIESRGYDRDRGVFVQAFDSPAMDAALLLLPRCGFVAYKDPRMVRTTEAVREELSEQGLLRRYASDGDGLEGREGAFIACSFWLAECLARQDRRAEARAVYKAACATSNDLGLFSEEYDPVNAVMLGNFPQALTHLSQITAAVALTGLDEEPA